MKVDRKLIYVLSIQSLLCDAINLHFPAGFGLRISFFLRHIKILVTLYMIREWCMRRTEQKFVQSFHRKNKGKILLGNQTQASLKQMGCYGVDCIQGSLRGSCEHGGKCSVCIKCGVFDYVKSCQLFTKGQSYLTVHVWTSKCNSLTYESSTNLPLIILITIITKLTRSVYWSECRIEIILGRNTL